MKTPKEEAKDLIDLYLNKIISFLSENMKRLNAKQCAIICVDEILNLDFFSLEGREYWEEVKKELELL